MKLFLILFLCLPVFAVEDEKTVMLKEIENRKLAYILFNEKVSEGDKCFVRDYKCFKEQLMNFTTGSKEDLIGAYNIISPFYVRSVKEGDPPCVGSCLQNMLAHHIDAYLKFIMVTHKGDRKETRVSAYPTVDGTRIRTIFDLSAIGATMKNVDYLETRISQLRPGEITDPEVKDISRFKKDLEFITQGAILKNSVLCHLSEGDLVYEEIMAGRFSDKKSDENLAKWLTHFQDRKSKICESTEPLDYRGLDESTRKHFEKIREKKLANVECKQKDFACMRKTARVIGIHYADDLMKVKERLDEILAALKPKECDETCEAQFLIRTIQTWISYYSTFDRSKLASTLDWKVYPEARFLTIKEDLLFYESTKTIFQNLITAFGKIDPRNVKDPGLKSELKSVGKDLSDFASGRQFKESVICTMDPWVAAYDKYLSPTKDRKENQKFEEAFLEFKSNVCK